MCGIFGYIGEKKKAGEIVLNGLKILEYRGYDSWGVAVMKEGKDPEIVVKKRVGKIGDARIDDLPISFFSFGHTRWATHGGVTEKNSHPHLDCSKKIAIIHNGIIENYADIKNDLLKKGHHFVSETDTEVIAHLIEEHLKNPKNTFLNAVRLSFNSFIGLNAIIAMNSQSQEFIAAKNGSPLVIGKGSHENLLSSDAHALLEYTNKVYFMEDEEIVLIGKDNIKVFDTKGVEKHVKFQTLNWEKSASQKGKFPHFMLKEIYDQKIVIEKISQDSVSDIERIGKLIKNSFGTHLVGCGTASYACLAGTYLFSKIAKLHVNFSVGSEFAYFVDFLTPKSLVIALSQSGETIDVVDAIKKAKEKNVKIATLVNVLGSTLYRLSDDRLLLQAGPEKAVVSTKAFTAKIAYLLLIAYYISGQYEKGKNILKKSLLSLHKILTPKYTSKIIKLVEFLKNKEHIYCIGRGPSYPIALETALKIKEASYIHSEGFAAGELKHGVIALIEKGTPCIAFLPNDETYGSNLAGAMEMKARGGYIIGISYKNHEVFDYYLGFEDCLEASMIPSVVIGQLLAYYLSIEKGYDPDKPRNLAKSVTVK